MPYVMTATGSGATASAVYSVVFGSTFPSPRNMWASINGYKGLDVRYGDDALVNTYGAACTAKGNTAWRIVDVVSKKRDVEGVEEVEDGGSMDPKIKERIEKDTKAGKTMEEIIHDIAMEDCLKMGKMEMSDELLMWIRMNGLKITQFDTICDKVSDRVHFETSTVELDDDKQGSSHLFAPVWVIVTASIGCTLLLVAVITLVVLYLRKKNEADVGNSYTEMRE